MRRACRAGDRHEHDRRVHAPGAGGRGHAPDRRTWSWTAWRHRRRSDCSCGSASPTLRADPRPGDARRAHGREGPEGGAGRDASRRGDAADRARAADRAGSAAPRRRPAPGERRSRSAPRGDPGLLTGDRASVAAARRRSWPAATCRPASCTGPAQEQPVGRRRTWPAATDFPTCGGEFLPFGRSRALDIHLTHRAFMYVTVVVAAGALRDGPAAAPPARRAPRRRAGSTLRLRPPSSCWSRRSCSARSTCGPASMPG